MNRREFLYKTAAGAALAGLGNLPVLAAGSTRHLTILHTNDVHSYIDPFPADHPKYPGKGGVARRAAMIESIRLENPNVLLLDAGDIFQGTPYFNYYGGELEFKLMSMMKYDLATMGNHDFDNGIDGFLAQLPNANFDFVSANYDFSKTALDGRVKPYKIFNKNGIKVGVFGLGVELEGLVNPKHFKDTKYLDPVEITQDMVRELKGQRCDVIIALSHLGFKYPNDPAKISDVKLVEKTSGIDLIVGGHTHTFLDKPVTVKNAEGKDVLVNQTGCYGVNLGRVDFYFDSVSTSSHGRLVAI
jgi:5'-nucleotidase